MEQRNITAGFDCGIIGCSIGQRYLDDSKCDNHRKYNYSNGSEEICQHPFQVLHSITIGKLTFSFKNEMGAKETMRYLRNGLSDFKDLNTVRKMIRFASFLFSLDFSC